MFDLFKKKLKEVVSKITGKIEDETQVKEAPKGILAKEKTIEKKHISKKITKKTKEQPTKIEETQIAGPPKTVEVLEEKKEGFLSKLFGKKNEELNVEDKEEGFIEKITKAVTHKELTEDFLKDALWELELVLLENNVASDVAEKIVNDIKANLKGKSVSRRKSEEIIEQTMAKSIREILGELRPL